MSPAATTPPQQLRIRGCRVELPAFFPSVSSVKTNWPPVDYVRALSLLRFPHYLVSAYDVAQGPSDQGLSPASVVSESANNGFAVLPDSGNYQGFWKVDGSWSRGRFHQVFERSGAQIAFCYDNQHPPSGLDALVAEVENSVAMDQSIAARTTVLPIIHGHVERLPEACKVVGERLHPTLLAVPERCLGDGLVSRAATVGRIRETLNGLPQYVPLHLLGTGNPTSILLSPPELTVSMVWSGVRRSWTLRLGVSGEEGSDSLIYQFGTMNRGRS